MPGTDDAESEHDIAHLQPAEWRTTVRSLVQTQPATQLGGGHTNKLQLQDLAQHCVHTLCNSSFTRGYSAWRIARHVLGKFLARCQFKFGGLGKSPCEHPR